jgi:hypothetical protein
VNEGLFQMTAVVLWLAAWSIAAVLRIGAAGVPGQTRRIDVRLVWQTGWSSVWGTGFHDPVAVAWGGASLTVAWLALLALPGESLRPDVVPGLSISGISPLSPFLGLVLLSDWLSRQSRRSDGEKTIPWQGWCAVAASSAPVAWNGLFGTTDIPVAWIWLWMPAAAAVWSLACTADLRSLETEPGLSRLAGVLRRWAVIAFGIVIFWGGGALPGVASRSPLVACLVVTAELLMFEVVLSLAVRRWLPTVPSAEVWLVAVVTGLAGGPLAAALIDGLGKDSLLVGLSQLLLLVCGLLIARQFSSANSRQSTGDIGSNVG